MSLILDATRISRSTVWLDLMPKVVTLFKDGDALRPVEAGWLAEWMAGIGRDDLDPGDVQTVQIPRSWAAEVLGHDERASRALQALQVAGILTPIRKGIKGHASLYCVNPLPSVRGPTPTHGTGECGWK